LKNKITSLLRESIDTLQAKKILPANINIDIHVTESKTLEHGDYATNIALKISKEIKTQPIEVAKNIISIIEKDKLFKKIEIAGPGFINFFIETQSRNHVLQNIFKESNKYGFCKDGNNEKVLVEFVSANPTGPLHIGHGRGAAYGACVCNLLEANGYVVDREYYINDKGRQIDILVLSVWIRYLELCDMKYSFPKNGYHGDYIWDIAAQLHRNYEQEFIFSSEKDLNKKLEDEEEHLDYLITLCKESLGENKFYKIQKVAVDILLEDIKEDLKNFDVKFENWFSEKESITDNNIRNSLKKLQSKGQTYIKDGATWFSSSLHKDEKDRVLIKENGQTTYFSADIAYHEDKIKRKYKHIINIWGADHHGYVARLKAAMLALGYEHDTIEIILVQFANLRRSGKKISMSTRSGQFITLRGLRKEVGKDAARFFYVMRNFTSHIDFDVDLAKSKTTDNPVYYVQYAHARICSVLNQANKQGIKINTKDEVNSACLQESNEINLLKLLASYPDQVKLAANQREPQRIVKYLRDLAGEFHVYYNKYKFITDEKITQDARLKLILATKQIIKNGLKLIDVSAPEKM
jgi:arginyl-tRNA synthetase